MLTLKDVTRRKTGMVMWDKDHIMVLNWMGIEGIPKADGNIGFSGDLVSVTEKLTTQDLTKDELDNLLARAEGANIDGIWRIGKTIVVTFEGWP